MQSNNNNNNVCRLCLKLVRSANVAFINEVMREMLRLLLIKLDLDASEHPLVCRTCSRVLDEIYLFKSKCLYTEDMIRDHIETDSKVSLRDILIEMENKREIYIGEDEVVCRLCIKISLNGSCITLGETGDGFSFIRDTMQVYLPEIDMSMSEKPIICEVCHVQLKNVVSFATNCMAVEEKIQLYCDYKKISGPVDLARVLQSTEDKALDLQNSLDKDLVIKQEDDLVMVKVEKVQNAEDYILEGLIDSSSTSELYLKNEEIEIKSENDEMSKEMDDYVQTAASDNSGESGSLKRIRKSPLKGRKCVCCDDHMARHRGRNKLSSCCRDCTFKTDRKQILARHMVRHKDKTEVKMHKCENCEFMTRWRRSLSKHIMVKHRDRRAETKFKCNKCPYETDFKWYISKHNLIHKDKSEVVMYKCENCEYETKRKSDLNKHIMIMHRDRRAERKFKCIKCPFQTDSECYIRRHNLIHKDKSEVETYKCENSEYETRHKYAMKQHMVRHRDPRAERRFKCDRCPYETDYKSAFHNHNLRHKDKSEAGMYKCANCEYMTRRKDNFIRHMLTHRDPRAEREFKCDRCPYETDVKYLLGRHNLIHKDKSEVAMHKCVNCQYETKRKRNLILHMVKHRNKSGGGDAQV